MIHKIQLSSRVGKATNSRLRRNLLARRQSETGLSFTMTLKSQITLDFRVALCGFTSWFCFYGFLRATTFIQSTLVTYYNQSTEKSELYIDACFQLIVAGFCVGGILCGKIIPKYGVKNPVRIASIIPFVCFICLAISTKLPVSIIYPLLIFPAVGVPIGICLTCSNRAIGDHGNENYSGVLIRLRTRVVVFEV